MSLSRLALRLAAVEALSPWSAIQSGMYPTPAGPRVYDSRQDPIDGLSELETKPILIVYTEDDSSDPYGTAKYPADEQVVVLVVEQMIAAKGSVTVNNPNGTQSTIGTVDAAISDQQQESLLDLVEATVRRLLDTRNRAGSSAIFNLVAMEIRRIESQPLRADDKITRLAARTLKLHVKIKKDKWPPVAIAPAPVGLSALPSPLSDVAAALDLQSDAAALCTALLAQIQPLQPAPLVPLQQIGITSSLDGNTAPTVQTANVVLTDPAATPVAPSLP